MVDDFFIEFIIIGPLYIREWVGGVQGEVGGEKGQNKEVRQHK